MTENKNEYIRSSELLNCENSRLLIVDMQEKLLPAIPVHRQLIENCDLLCQAAKLLAVPLDATEQYPKGLGGTVPELISHFERILEKERFSCMETLDWNRGANERFQVIVAGIEAHVCILQTVLDLVARGNRVHVVADAVGSRHKTDWKFALKRMADSGATLTTSEAVIFEWCQTSQAIEFKELSKLVKNR